MATIGEPRARLMVAVLIVVYVAGCFGIIVGCGLLAWAYIPPRLWAFVMHGQLWPEAITWGNAVPVGCAYGAALCVALMGADVFVPLWSSLWHGVQAWLPRLFR